MCVSSDCLAHQIGISVVLPTHIPVPAREKNKKKRTAERRPHTGRTACNVKMTSPCRISANSGFHGSIFHVFQYSGEQEKEAIIRVNGISTRLM